MADRMTPHQRAAYDRARVVPDDTFLQEKDLQGPQPMPRNYLADLAREYGMPSISDRLNSPTSGVGMLVDAVGGLGNALVVQPAQSFNRLLQQGYEPGNPQSAEDAFNVAGAAMVGGFAAPRPRGSIGMSGRPEGAATNAAAERQALDMSHAARMQRAREMGFDTDTTWYRGGKTGRDELKPVASDVETPAIWFSNSPDRASEFATLRAHYGNMADLKADYNPSVTPAYTRGNYKTIEGMFQAPNFERMGQQMEKAKAEGYDGVVFKRINDRPGATGPSLFNSSDVLALFDGSNVRSPNAAFDPAKSDSANILYSGGRPGAAVGAATNALAERPGIRAYHGSPHDFDKFDMSKIGTGEGAQAYGHGLYFAEREGVAKSYRDALGGQKLKDGTSFDERNPAHWAAEYVSRADGDTSKALDLLRADMTPDMKTYEGAQYQRLLRARGMIEKGETIPEIGRGKMYEVRINASPDDFLDWDKPISQQSEKVRQEWKKFKAKNPQYNDPKQVGGQYKDPTGKEFYSAYAEEVPGLGPSMRAGVTERLKTHGLSGIKYLDQGSRTAGEGSRNYVVFDDALVEILRKYGLLGMIGGGAVAGGLQSDANKQTDWARKMQPGDA